MKYENFVIQSEGHGTYGVRFDPIADNQGDPIDWVLTIRKLRGQDPSIGDICKILRALQSSEDWIETEWFDNKLSNYLRNGEVPYRYLEEKINEGGGISLSLWEQDSTFPDWFEKRGSVYATSYNKFTGLLRWTREDILALQILVLRYPQRFSGELIPILPAEFLDIRKSTGRGWYKIIEPRFK
jgi:hypothetical protein